MKKKFFMEMDRIARNLAAKSGLGPADLLPKRTGPQKPPKRTKEVESLIIRRRFETDFSMYEIAEELSRLGFDVSARLVAQVLTDYGMSKKTADTRVAAAAAIGQGEDRSPRRRLQAAQTRCPPPRYRTRHRALLKRGLTTTSADAKVKQLRLSVRNTLSATTLQSISYRTITDF